MTFVMIDKNITINKNIIIDDIITKENRDLSIKRIKNFESQKKQTKRDLTEYYQINNDKFCNEFREYFIDSIRKSYEDYNLKEGFHYDVYMKNDIIDDRNEKTYPISRNLIIKICFDEKRKDYYKIIEDVQNDLNCNIDINIYDKINYLSVNSHKDQKLYKFRCVPKAKHYNVDLLIIFLICIICIFCIIKFRIY